MSIRHGGETGQSAARRKSLHRRVGILFAKNWELLKVFEQRQDVIKTVP